MNVARIGKSGEKDSSRSLVFKHKAILKGIFIRTIDKANSKFYNVQINLERTVQDLGLLR